MHVRQRQFWYTAGLAFECQGCGNCCSGPGEGYIWVNRPELERIARFLNLPADECRRRYCRREGLRTTLIEQETTRDCIFLRKTDGGKRCVIYPVRPTQCRTWPFWAGNLRSPADWNEAARRCPGINRGRVYDIEQIERLRKTRDWTVDEP